MEESWIQVHSTNPVPDPNAPEPEGNYQPGAQSMEDMSDEVKERYGVEDESLSDMDIKTFTLITLMRLYDVNMALLNLQDRNAATMLHEAHAKGETIGSFPWLEAG